MINELTPEERILRLKKMRWIDYSQASEILSIFSDLLHHQGITRIPCPMIIGNSNSGKTELLKKFASLNKPQIIEGEDYLHVPVLYIITPPKASEQRLYNEILSTLKIPHRERTDIDFKMNQTLDALINVRCKVILIDEIQQITSAPPNKQREFLNTIKFIMNKTGVSIVCAGVEEAKAILMTDHQIANRFTAIEIKPWKLNEEYAQMIHTIKSSMELRNDSGKIDLEMAKLIYFQTEGLLGEMAQFIQKAAIFAIKSGSECIDLEALKSVKWVRPSERRYS